jgi:hypothetical protein
VSRLKKIGVFFNYARPKPALRRKYGRKIVASLGIVAV